MTQSHRALRLSLTYLIAVLLLVGMFALAVGSSRDLSPVLSESHTYSDLASMGIITSSPTGVDIAKVAFLTRFPMMLVGLLLAALMFRWARHVYGLWPGLIALTLVAFSPTIIAYSQLAIPDLAGAALALAALYCWTRFLHHPSRRRAAAGGVLAGLALVVSFLAIPLIVSLFVMTLWHGVRSAIEGRRHARLLLIPWLAFAVTLAAVWAIYSVLIQTHPAIRYLGGLVMTFSVF